MNYGVISTRYNLVFVFFVFLSQTNFMSTINLRISSFLSLQRFYSSEYPPLTVHGLMSANCWEVSWSALHYITLPSPLISSGKTLRIHQGTWQMGQPCYSCGNNTPLYTQSTEQLSWRKVGRCNQLTSNNAVFFNGRKKCDYMQSMLFKSHLEFVVFNRCVINGPWVRWGI